MSRELSRHWGTDLGSLHVLRLEGQLDILNTERIHEAIGSVPVDAVRIVLDLSAVTSVDSMVLSTLILAAFKWNQEGRVVATVVTNANLARMMNILSLTDRLNVVGSMQEALVSRG